MWLADRRQPSALVSASNQIRKKIKRRSHKYSLYKSKRKDVGSERVDWEFVGFPRSSDAAANGASPGSFEPPLTFEPLRRKPTEHVPVPSATSSHDYIDFSQLAQPAPPPVPPRTTGARSKRPPPPRPSSLYAKLTPSIHPTDEYSQVNKPARRKRPRSSDLEQQLQEPIKDLHQPPRPPPHLNLESRPLPMVPPHSYDEVNPRPLHGSGVPIPLPNSPPAPPPPPHASPNTNAPGFVPGMNPYEFNPFFPHSRGSTLDSPFYQRPMSLKSRLSSLARSLSPSLIHDDDDDEDDELLELFTEASDIAVPRQNPEIAQLQQINDILKNAVLQQQQQHQQQQLLQQQNQLQENVQLPIFTNFGLDLPSSTAVEEPFYPPITTHHSEGPETLQPIQLPPISLPENNHSSMQCFTELSSALESSTSTNANKYFDDCDLDLEAKLLAADLRSYGKPQRQLHQVNEMVVEFGVTTYLL